MEFLPPLGLKKEWAPLKLKEDASAPKLPANTILIFPSSRGKWAQKEWPHAHMKELTQKLLAQGAAVAWCSDEKLEVPGGALDFCQKVKLGELLPFIAQARLLIGNDAGPTHMACALGLPTLGLYGPTTRSWPGLIR